MTQKAQKKDTTADQLDDPRFMSPDGGTRSSHACWNFVSRVPIFFKKYIMLM
jgi:hypothetical protein